MNEWMLLLVLIAAIAIGWGLGRFSLKKRHRSSTVNSDSSALNKDYFAGLTFLLNDEQDKAVETFMRLLEINPETVDTHIAMGNLFRSKGETEKAIRLHQNLFARPTLSRALTHKIQLELARDFFAAGLFDRAERLLIELNQIAQDDLRLQSQRLLIRIYEQEKEWHKAIEVSAHKLLKEIPEQKAALAHYYCELAEQQLTQNDFSQAKKTLKQALYNDSKCMRANWICAELELKNHAYKKAIHLLQRIPEQDPRFYSVVLPKIAEHLSTKELHNYLDLILRTAPSHTAISLKASLIEQERGADEAFEFIAQQTAELKAVPIKLAANMLQLVTAPSSEVQNKLQRVVQQLITSSNKAHYYLRCQKCGYKSQQVVLWQCPKCRHWGTLRPDDLLTTVSTPIKNIL
ncbi:Lipopolysaccharide biosynthesis regulator YciM, contains six TPR domains and a predicted metal-binding C-terminal domain [Oceanospirillum multiglobuliferum]|uniref:Lipopolysaccharide assembly protein B n=1 Tax=Oceanospirillum multiglobuliferum TaxID=64969 RepID=A0A1T4KMT3_9GAMM|nr:lipopolysaccharide assembly protein LapB [Oceanospirillum multiglobuliferum]OPX56077.1 lipopolysaccharide assembly protein LapB [Oceanospirillum multiglobuliferum]SJZ43714.1 Lipopolysaccharide biosynthesis regulator YciM, contains six TPR domains and a predicted metal-binding C-terminal domain [Oceanospirillum multiglobuliferum]